MGSGEETRARDTCRNSASYCSRTERGQDGEKQKAESHNGRVQRLDHEKDLQDSFSRQLEGEPRRKAALCPSDFPQLLQGSQRVWEEMKPLLVLRKTPFCPGTDTPRDAWGC